MEGTRPYTPPLLVWGAVLAGIFITFPSLVPSVGDASIPRTTDLLNFACAILLGLALLRTADLHVHIHRTLIVWAMALPWIVMELWALGGTSDPPVQRVLIRWILCGFSAYYIAVLADDAVLRPWFLFGLLAGVVCSALTLLYDFMTFSPEDLPIDQLVNLAIYDGKSIHDFVYRAAGIFGHPNAAAGCVLVGVPILIGAIQEGRLPRWSIVFALALMGAVFYLTKSRGPLLTSGILVVYWGWSITRHYWLPIVLAACGVLAGALFIGQFVPGLNDRVLMDRFVDLDSIAVNAGERWWTISTSLDLMLRNPLGMGSAYVVPLDIATGTSATHNAYLELALMGGIPLMLLVVFRLLKAASALRAGRAPVEAWLAAYLIGIFAFESFFLQVNIQLLMFWLLVSPLRPLGASDGGFTSVAGATAPGPQVTTTLAKRRST